MDHVTQYYLEKTPLTQERLTALLKTDTDMNARECVTMGLVEGVR
jgi:ATP-dependent protease ClpP protease subunit